MTDKELVDDLIHELSCHIQPWMRKHYPHLEDGQIEVGSLNMLIIGFMNFAGINCSIAVKTAMSTWPKELQDVDKREKIAATLRTLIELFTKVFEENMKKDETPKP